MCGAALRSAGETPTATVAASGAHAGHAPAAPPSRGAAIAAPYAGFWRRAVASLLDNVLLFFPIAIARALVGAPVMNQPMFTEDGTQSVINLGAILLGWLYCALQESSAAGGTLGQRTMGMRVTDVDGRRLSFARATGRYFAQVFTLLTCSLGFLFQLWTARRQTLHDLASGCVFTVPSHAPPAGAESEGHA